MQVSYCPVSIPRHPKGFTSFSLLGSGAFDLSFARGWGFCKMS